MSLTSSVTVEVETPDFSVSQLWRVSQFSLQRPFPTTNYLEELKTITGLEPTQFWHKFYQYNTRRLLLKKKKSDKETSVRQHFLVIF